MHLHLKCSSLVKRNGPFKKWESRDSGLGVRVTKFILREITATSRPTDRPLLTAHCAPLPLLLPGRLLTAQKRTVDTELKTEQLRRVSKTRVMKALLRTLLIFCLSVGYYMQPQSQNVGIGTTTPDQKLEIEGAGDQLMRVHTTSTGSSIAGLELIRGTEFNSTDWQILNEGGVLSFLDGSDNFLTAGQENMRITQSGNVGIGITTPQSRLHVGGQGDQMLIVHNTSFGGNLSGIELLRGTNASSTDWRIVNDGGILKFFDGIDNFDTPGTENMRITQSGNVGIGLIGPQAHLQVNGSTFLNATNGGNFLRVGSSTGSYIAMDNNEILAKNSSNEASTLYLQYWGGNLALCYENNGRVGIGTSSPNAKVHVQDGTDVNYGGGGQLVLGPTSSANLALDGNEILARNNGAEAPLFLQISGGDVLMTPNENGQVGIGVTSMANMPSDEYLLAVDGKIMGEEVRVEMSGSWPDYVFAEDYKLKPLDLLESEIAVLGHLPGIPDARTIESEGFDLGNMQTRMMEKIEELTLYMIDADREIKALKAEVADLKARK